MHAFAQWSLHLWAWPPTLLSKIFPLYRFTSHFAWKELLRGCRMHFNRLVKDLSENDLDKARLGLGHAFSRHRMQLDPNRQEKPLGGEGSGIQIIQGNFRWVMWVPESCFMPIGMDLRNVMCSSKTEFEVLFCGCTSTHQRLGMMTKRLQFWEV